MKAIINALQIALFEEHRYEFADAKRFAAEFVEDNADLFVNTITGRTPSAPAVPRERQPEDPEKRAVVHYVPVVGPDGLTDKQRAAVGGVGLCQNCQQPKNSHLPACAVQSGYDPKARTKDPLPPAV